MGFEPHMRLRQIGDEDMRAGSKKISVEAEVLNHPVKGPHKRP